MKLSRSSVRTAAFSGLTGFSLTLGFGCGGDSNEKEFLNSAPPGTPSEFPDEKVSDRRQRLMGKEVSKKGAKKPAAGAEGKK